MIKKFQVFVSSTYTDLKQERKDIFNTLLRSNCIPSGMEFFPSVDLEQFELIKKYLELCDYYLLVIKRRYGSICNRTKKSYTEMEYEYAIEKGIPVIAFIYAGQPHNLKLKQFIKSVKTNRNVSFWKDKKDLIEKISTSINNFLTENSRLGWIRETSSAIQTNVRDETIYKFSKADQITKTLLDKEDFNAVNIGEKLYYIWKTTESEQGQSKEEFASLIGLPPDEIDDYFHGKKQFCDYSLLLRIITLFNLPDDYFIKPTYYGKFAFWKKDIVKFSILQKITSVEKISMITPDFYYQVIMDLALNLENFSNILNNNGLDTNPFSETNGVNFFANYNIPSEKVKRQFEMSYYKILELSEFDSKKKELSPIEQIVQKWFFLCDSYLWYLFTVSIESISLNKDDKP